LTYVFDLGFVVLFLLVLRTFVLFVLLFNPPCSKGVIEQDKAGCTPSVGRGCTPDAAATV
jgi:hypothetical protein